MCFFKKTFMDGLVARAITANAHSKKVLVFPETEEHILRACNIILKKNIATPLILGNKKRLQEIFRQLKLELNDTNIMDYMDAANQKQLEAYTTKFIDMRQKDSKTVNIDEARRLMSLPHYYSAMMLAEGKVDGMISGINSETKPYLPAFQIIKTREGISRASGLFIMDKKDKTYFFADCGLNINPTSEQLAEIALTTAQTVIEFGLKPKIAMLSFSTHDSAQHEMVDKVKNAVKIIKDKDKELMIDGEIQLDAAIVPEVAKKKAPDSVLAGNANVLIFPDLNSGNIGYKLAQRLGGYTAIGPIMQGLNKPVNDLSRGASVEDVVYIAAVTVLQGL
jgi:phosphate acetyltransferase